MTHSSGAFQDKTRFDGDDLRSMFAAATRLFEGNVQSINALNVFPVPDGDTGTNMFLTLREVMKEAEGAPSSSASETASRMARGALMGARGNSGVILSQFFKGLAVGLEGRPDFGPAQLASAFDSAREYAYKAVGEPVEGTLLTVISSVARAAMQSADLGKSLPALLNDVCAAAAEAVALTPTMLPVLREAGVVDAGGHGLSIILEGARRSVRGEASVAVEIPPPEARGVEAGTGAVSQDFLTATEEELYGYCTQFLVEGQGLDPDAVRERMAALAGSTVVVGDDSTLNVHVHVDDPGPVLSYAVSLGNIRQVKIDNMDEQHRDYSATRRQHAVAQQPQTDVAPIAVVVVAWGRGLEMVFAGLGAAKVIEAGDTMNPSVQEIVDAVKGTGSEEVILLPNNRNIVPAARQAVELFPKTLKVVESKTIPQGIAALLAFNPDAGIDDNVAEMERMLSSVRTGEVCHAVRPVVLNGVTVEEGQIIGLLERELVAAADEPTSALMSLLATAEVSDGDLVTLYWGGGLASDDAEAAQGAVEAAFPGAEVELVEGGQPHYHYIVSIE